MQTKFVNCVGVNNFIKCVNSFSITFPSGDKGSFDSSLINPPIPLKQLLKRRRAFLTPYDKLRIEAQVLNDNCRGDGCRWQPFIADRVEDENMLCV